MKHDLPQKTFKLNNRFTLELAVVLLAIVGCIGWLAYFEHQSALQISHDVVRFETSLQGPQLFSYKQLVSNVFDDYLRSAGLNLLSAVVFIFLCIVFIFCRWINLKQEYIKNFIENESFSVSQTPISEKKDNEKTDSQCQDQVFELLAYLGHEIRTPVSALIGYLDNARRLTEGTPRRVIDKAKETAEALVENLGVFLESSKFSSGTVVLQEEKMVVHSLITDVSNVVYLTAEKKGIDLYLDISPNVSNIVFADPLRIKQVLINLINNSIKFTSQGYVKLSVEQSLISDEEIELIFTVRDTGIGISSEKSKNLFQRFEQVEGQFVKEYGGSGLGLFICKKIADLMKGDVSIQSRKLKGTKSIFRVPVKTVQRSVPARNMAKLDTALLVLSPNEEEISVFANGLKDCYECFYAATSFETLEDIDFTAHKNLDVVLNVDLLYSSKFRTKALYTNLRNKFEAVREVGLVSFSNQDKHIKDLHNIGVTSYLIKPVMANEIMAKLDGVVQEDKYKIKTLQEQCNSIDGKRILLVEDTESLREMTSDSLRSFGAYVECASNGAEGASMALNPLNKYDFVLMDIQMPFLDGIQAALRIRKHFDKKALPIFALTSHSLEHELQKCYSAGMNECLCKPIDINRLCGFFLSDDVTLSLARSTISESYSSDVVLNSVGAINRYAGRLELLVKAYELFLRDAGAYINKISSTASNPQELGDLVHKLKGVGGMIGADRLAHACELFEKMLYDQSEDCKCIDMVKSELSSVLKQTKIEVEQQLSSC